MWEYAVTLVPSWIAPNVITLCGCSIQISAFYLYCYLDPYFEGAINSSSIYLIECLALFLYNTLDAIDGKHARNTHNSSPLGQLFDHGCDALCLNTVVMHVACVGIETGWYALYVLIGSQITFYALNWKARHTGEFDFGQFSVDETGYIGMTCLMVHAVKGNAFLKGLRVFGQKPLDIILGPMSISFILQWFVLHESLSSLLYTDCMIDV